MRGDTLSATSLLVAVAKMVHPTVKQYVNRFRHGDARSNITYLIEELNDDYGTLNEEDIEYMKNKAPRMLEAPIDNAFSYTTFCYVLKPLIDAGGYLVSGRRKRNGMLRDAIIRSPVETIKVLYPLCDDFCLDDDLMMIIKEEVYNSAIEDLLLVFWDDWNKFIIMNTLTSRSYENAHDHVFTYLPMLKRIMEKKKHKVTKEMVNHAFNNIRPGKITEYIEITFDILFQPFSQNSLNERHSCQQQLWKYSTKDINRFANKILKKFKDTREKLTGKNLICIRNAFLKCGANPPNLFYVAFVSACRHSKTPSNGYLKKILHKPLGFSNKYLNMVKLNAEEYKKTLDFQRTFTFTFELLMKARRIREHKKKKLKMICSLPDVLITEIVDYDIESFKNLVDLWEEIDIFEKVDPWEKIGIFENSIRISHLRVPGVSV